MNSQQQKTIYLKEYTPPDFLIQRVELDFDIQDEHIIVTSYLHIHRNAQSKKTNAPFILDGEKLTLLSIEVDEKPLSQSDYTVSDTQLIIPAMPNSGIVKTIVKIHPKKNTTLMGLYQSKHTICTQCEAEGFRRITYFIDRPDVMSYFTTSITADKTRYPYLLSNGNLIEEKTLQNNRHYAKWEDPSLKPCYLFALVAGDFDLITDQFITMSKKTVNLDLYLEKGFLDQGAYAMTALKKSMQWDEDRFGREYDLNRYMIVAVSDFNMGAMENKGLNIFNTKYVLAKPSTATDTDYINIERVIGHEYFHNWSGNRVTCRDWFQLTLKEGLTVFRDQSFTEDMTSKGVARIDVVNTLRNQQFPEDAGPMAHPIRPQSYMKIDNFYTVTVYEKGAEVIRMVQTLLSPAIFRKGMDLYFSRYDGKAVTTDDFISAMEDASGKDLTQFKRWYDYAGTPVLQVKTHYNEKQKTVDVVIQQSGQAVFHMPFAMGLVGKECVDLDLQLQGENAVHAGTVVLEIKNPEEKFTFVNINENPTPSLLRHFSAPVVLHYDYTNAQLSQLLQCDSDAYCRWEAAQRLFVNMIEMIATQIIDKKTLVLPDFLSDAFEKLLTTSIEDKSLLARLLVFPSLKYVLSQLPRIDLTILFDAKQFLENALAKKFESLWLALYEDNQLTGEYRYDIHDCGLRRIKNVALYYLLKTDNKKYAAMAFEQATQSNNMTDRLGGLSALNNYDDEMRHQALSHFYDTYQHEPLVVNKWLMLQASTTLPRVLADVKKLIHHPAFDIHNPNNVYAIFVTLGENTLRFHDKSGEAYRLLADTVLLIDKNNPQLSARIVNPLTQWRQIDVERGALMKAELMRLLDTKKLSENLYEIVSKSVT